MNICRKKIELEVNKDEPWDGDLLKRKVVADDFSKLVNDISQPFVIAINSPYGTGKTFFLKRWAIDLQKNKNNIVVFFNAWSTDFEEDPLIPFIHTILSELPRNKIQTLSEKTKELLVSIKDYGNFITEFCGGPEHAAEKFAHILNPIKDYEKKLKLIESFKNEVKKVICGKKLLIFVDELERCRPTYAVETLEVIKHLFDIENVTFILGIDRIQLQSTIANLYGTDMDKDGYLRRFIDLELTLPEPNLTDFCSLLCKEFEIKNENASNEQNFTNGWACFCEYFSKLSFVYKLSLREIIQCFTAIKVIQSTIPDNTIKMMPILAWLLALKCKKPTMFSEIESLSCDELVNEFNTVYTANFKDNSYFSYDMIAMIRALKTSNIDDEIEKTNRESAFIRGKNQISFAEAEKVTMLANKVKELVAANSLWRDIAKHYYHTERLGVLPYLLRLVRYIGIN